MSLFSRLRQAFSRPAQRPVKAHYDNARPGGENAEHWRWADSLNANALNSPDVRKRLRERARYEEDNNGPLEGLIDTLGDDLIGSMPRIQITIPGVSRSVSREIERTFHLWGRSIQFGSKLRMLDRCAYIDGEGFALFVHNRNLDPLNAQIDLRLYETDQVTTPFVNYSDPQAFDGGRTDESGNVCEWHFLRTHPGSPVWQATLDPEVIPASRVLHWFNPRRPGQFRGVPEIQSSLGLYAILRRYTLATLGAAETAANIAGVLESNMSPDGGPAPQFATMEEVDIPRRALLTLPAGYKATAFDAKQPVSSYKEFRAEILTEGGAPVKAPRNIATGSSAEYNYSSARMDHGRYQAGIKVRRNDLRDRILDRVFREWLSEIVMITGFLPAGLPPFARWSWEWFFDGFIVLDPVKDATADDMRLANGTTTYAEIFAERGQDWEEQFAQQAAEQKLRRELGIVSGSPRPMPTEDAAP